jgi:hypothetical protein
MASWLGWPKSARCFYRRVQYSTEKPPLLLLEPSGECHLSFHNWWLERDGSAEQRNR